MTPRVVRHWMIRVGLIGGTALVLAACPEDAADITEIASEPSLDFTVVSAYVEPVGSFSLERFLLADFDTAVADAFGRATDDLPAWQDDEWFVWGAPAHQAWDPRAPTITATDPVIVGTGVVCDAPQYAGVGHYAFYVSGVMDALPANTEYTVAFVRYGVQVNAELDQAAILLGEPITQKDSLVVLNPNPLGDPTVDINTAVTGNDGDTVFAQVGANPFIIGHANTDGTGTSDFGIVISAAASDGTPVFWAGQDVPPTAAMRDSALVGRNDGVAYGLPRYNYIVMFEGQGVTGPTVARLQIAQDMDLNGQPLHNGFYPMPSAAASPQELLQGPGGAGKPDSLVMTFNNLQALAGGAAYEPWLANPLTGSMVPASGTYYRIQLIPVLDPVTGEVISIDEDTVETISDASGFVGGNEEDGYRHALVISDASLAAGDSIGLHSHVMLTVTGSPGGGTPSDSRPLWFAYTDQNDTPDNYFDDSFNPDNGITSFGNFNASDPTGSRKYSGEGKGTGGVREDVLSVDLRNLSRPPVGYILVGWLLRPDGTAFRLPDVTGPPPEYASLLNADTELMDDVVTETGIIDANVRVVAGEAGVAFSDFLGVLITLEPKYGTGGPGPIPVQMGALPEE